MSPTRTLLSALLILSLGGTALYGQRGRGAVAPAENAKPPAILGVELQMEGGRVKVVGVLPDSQAQTLGIRPGDVIVSAGGGPVGNPEMLQRLLALANTRGLKLDLVLDRAGSAITVQVGASRASGRMAARLGALNRPPISDPGEVSLPVAAPVPGQGFNVLRYAALDSRTGEVVCWGDYDPAYSTGALPYEALLVEALRNPSPSFTLEPTPAGRSAGQELDRRIADDAGRLARDPAYVQAYGLRLLRVLGTELAQRPDGRRFAKRCGEAFGLTPAEAMDVLQPERGQQARGEQGYMALLAKAVRHMGAPGAAEALETMLGGDTWGAIDRLGVGAEARAARDDFQAGRISKEQASTRMQGLVWGAFLTNTGMNAGIVESERTRRGPSGFLPWAQERFTSWVAEKVSVKMFNGLVLGEEAIQRLYPGLPSLQLQPTCLDGLDPKSTLAQVFLRADVAMKTILSLPDLADRVPGHRSQAEYQQAFLAQRGKGGSGGGLRARTWLQPAAVDLQVDPGGALVRFGEARVSIRSRMLEDTGRLGSVQQEGLDAYATELSSRYEAYAKVEPELHRLREAAKVLALARWARARGLNVRPASGGSEISLGMVPKGFLLATFLMEGDHLYLQPASVGGVDFSPQMGDAWVQARPEAGVVPSALGQLQVSAALAGQAANKAAAGDLEGARILAQQSADAMTGRLPSGSIPEVPAPTPVDAFPMAQASTGLLGHVQTAAAKLQKAAPGSPEAEEARTELQGLHTQAQTLSNNPQSAPQVVALLRTPSSAPVSTPTAHPGSGSAPTVTTGVATAGEPLTPEDRRRILQETTALRSELCLIRAQFHKLDANLQADLARRTIWEQEIEGAYGRAWDRVKDVLIDMASEDVSGNWNDAIGKGERTAAERAKLAKGVRLLKIMKDARSFQDFSEWAEKEEVDADYIREGLTQIYDLVDGNEVLRKMLRRKLGRPISKEVMGYYDAGKALVDTAFDLTAEGFGWAQLRQLDRNNESFRAAVKALANRQTKVLDGIHARELKLGLPEGATKDDCEER